MSPVDPGKPGGRRERFEALWRRNLIEDAADEGSSVYQRLEDAYNEPHRHYHSMQHIDHCIEMLDDCRALLRQPDLVELAIWFHDAIFVPGNADNEARSAVLYQELAQNAHPDEYRKRIPRMIMATLHDGNALEDDDTHYLVDIDLSSFGLPWEDFLRDSLNLRRENQKTEDEDYYRGQFGFQRALLAREQFFRTEFFRQRFESRARDNLARYFEHLEQQQD